MACNSFAPYFSILPKEQQKCWSLLKGISEKGFVLYGGTALALRLGHRTSVDFDFFTHLHLDRKAIFRRYPFLNECERSQDEGDTLTLEVDNIGFSRPVKVSFFGGIKFGRVGNPDVSGEDGILIASLDDIMALKLKVILQRVQEKDYLDIAEMIERGVSISKGMSTAVRFFGASFQPAIALHTLVWFEDLDERIFPAAKRNIIIQKVKEISVRQDEISKMSAECILASRYLTDDFYSGKLSSALQLNFTKSLLSNNNLKLYNKLIASSDAFMDDESKKKHELSIAQKLLKNQDNGIDNNSY